MSTTQAQDPSVALWADAEIAQWQYEDARDRYNNAVARGYPVPMIEDFREAEDKAAKNARAAVLAYHEWAIEDARAAEVGTIGFHFWQDLQEGRWLIEEETTDAAMDFIQDAARQIVKPEGSRAVDARAREDEVREWLLDHFRFQAEAMMCRGEVDAARMYAALLSDEWTAARDQETGIEVEMLPTASVEALARATITALLKFVAEAREHADERAARYDKLTRDLRGM